MQARAVRTRERILAAATRLFAERGYAGAGVEAIAAGAGVNKQRIYAYYGSKEDLFQACLASVFSQAEEMLSGARAEIEAHPELLTTLICRSYFSLHRTLPEFWRLLAWANLEGRTPGTLLDTARKEEDSFLKKAFDAAVSRKCIRQTDFQVYILDVMSTVYFYHSNQKTLQRTFGLPSPERITESLQDLYQPRPEDRR